MERLAPGSGPPVTNLPNNHPLTSRV